VCLVFSPSEAITDFHIWYEYYTIGEGTNLINFKFPAVVVTKLWQYEIAHLYFSLTAIDNE
jgi:hypothetical protein